jgi:hypothetical protein
MSTELPSGIHGTGKLEQTGPSNHQRMRLTISHQPITVQPIASRTYRPNQTNSFNRKRMMRVTVAILELILALPFL